MSRSFTYVRQFKKAIYTTNHRNPEKDLLFKENLRQTIRFALATGTQRSLMPCMNFIANALPSSRVYYPNLKKLRTLVKMMRMSNPMTSTGALQL
jgi:hypothetical protein